MCGRRSGRCRRNRGGGCQLRRRGWVAGAFFFGLEGEGRLLGWGDGGGRGKGLGYMALYLAGTSRNGNLNNAVEEK